MNRKILSKGRIYAELLVIMTTSIILSIELCLFHLLRWIGIIDFGARSPILLYIIFIAPPYLLVRYVFYVDEEVIEMVEDELERFDEQ